MVDAESAACVPLRLEVRELLDVHAELLAEGLLGVGRVAGDAVQRGALSSELVEHLVVEAELVGAHRAEGERVEHQDGSSAVQVGTGEGAPILAPEPEFRHGRFGRDDRIHLRRPSSRTSER